MGRCDLDEGSRSVGRAGPWSTLHLALSCHVLVCILKVPKGSILMHSCYHDILLTGMRPKDHGSNPLKPRSEIDPPSLLVLAGILVSAMGKQLLPRRKQKLHAQLPVFTSPFTSILCLEGHRTSMCYPQGWISSASMGYFVQSGSCWSGSILPSSVCSGIQ